MSDAQAVHDRAVAVQRDADLAAVVATAARAGDRDKRRRRRPALRWRPTRREQPCAASQPVPAADPLG